MIFNYDTYSSSFKENSLTIGDDLSTKFYGSYPANMGELVSVDWQPSSGNLWLLEINTDILLANTITVFQTGFDCDAISSFVSSSGYDNLHFVKSSYENFELGDYNPYFLSEFSASVVSHGLTYTSSFVEPITTGSNDLLTSGIGSDSTTFYLVNTPLSNGSRYTVNSGIFHLSRNKITFDTFVSESGHSNWLPSASSWISDLGHGSVTFQVNTDFPDVVVKDPSQDVGSGLTFINDSTDSSFTASSYDYVQQFIQPDVDSNGYPISMKGIAMVHSGDSLWLRPSDSLPYWHDNVKYTTSGSNEYDFTYTGTVGIFGSDTKVAMSDGSWKNIQSIVVDDEVFCGYKSDSIDGHMRKTKLRDDQYLEGSNESWRSFEESNLEGLSIVSSLVSNIGNYKYRKWCTINGSLEVSPVECLLVKDGSDSKYKFKESRNITTSDKLVHSDKSDVDITSVTLNSGSLKDFYSFSLTDQDNYFVSQSMVTIQHYLV
jgi:hypothetical protein